MAQDDRLQFETYLRERELLLGEAWATYRGLDRSLLTLASGAIALSLVLLQQLDNPDDIGILLASWAFMFGCIVSVLFSLRASATAFRIALEKYETDLRSGSSKSGPCRATASVYRFNRSAMICYLIGTAMLLAFAFVNAKGM